MINLQPSGPCGDGGVGTGECWVQIGMAMGEFDENSNCQVPPPPPLSQRVNFTNNWEIFFEDIGAGGINNCYDKYYTGGQWSISQDSTVEFHVTYDGGTGYTGQPQFQAYAKGMYVNSGELYSTIDHAKASSEAYTGNTTLCPYLTYGPPYLHFGTDISGNFTGGAYELELQPQSQGVFVPWGGNPDTGQNVYPQGQPLRYWYTQLSNFPQDFQTNGPSTAKQPPYP